METFHDRIVRSTQLKKRGGPQRGRIDSYNRKQEKRDECYRVKRKNLGHGREQTKEKKRKAHQSETNNTRKNERVVQGKGSFPPSSELKKQTQVTSQSPK